MEHFETPEAMAVRDIVAAVYRTALPSGPDHEQAERALLSANPHLRGNPQVPAGTRVYLPHVGMTQPAVPGRASARAQPGPAGLDAGLSRSKAALRVLGQRRKSPLLGALAEARIALAENRIEGIV